MPISEDRRRKKHRKKEKKGKVGTNKYPPSSVKQ